MSDDLTADLASALNGAGGRVGVRGGGVLMSATDPTKTRPAPAYRAWHCGTCDNELVAFGDNGDLTCEACGLVYRPDPDGHSAACIHDGDVLAGDVPIGAAL